MGWLVRWCMMKQVMFLLIPNAPQKITRSFLGYFDRRNIHSCHFFQLSSETWRPWVKQSDQFKTKRQTKRKVKSILNTTLLPPPPKWKNLVCRGKVENAIFFLQTRKNNTTAPTSPKKWTPPPPKKKSSPVQSPVEIFQLANVTGRTLLEKRVIKQIN